MRVLVTDSDSRSALAATRSLGRGGHWVMTAGERHPSIASVSRYSQRFEEYPSPQRQPQQFVAAIAAMAARNQIDVLLPMSELCTLLLTEHAADLPQRARLPFASPQIVAKVSNKHQVLLTAMDLGLAVPRTAFLLDAAQIASLQSWDSFPAVIKPARSRIWVGDRCISTRVSYAADATELTSKLAAFVPEMYPILVQERIEGPGVGVFTCFREGVPIAWFSHQRLREKPPSGGVSVLCESAPLEPDAVDAAERLLRAMAWEGVAMVEFKRDRRDGSLRLMEINGRFWGSLQLAIDAGVDFPSLLLAEAPGSVTDARAPYPLGIRSRWLWGDASALAMILLRSRSQLQLPPQHPGRWRALWDFLHVWQRGTRYELERWDDLAPAWLEARRNLLPFGR